MPTRPQTLPIARPALALALALALAAAGAARAQDQPTATATAAATPYVETIPGTEIKFDMVPIPGGTFEMGSPDSEPERGDDEGPRHPVKIAPFWMGMREVTWEEYDQFAFAFDLRKKTRDKVDVANQPESEKAADALTRPTPPFADETFGFGRRGRPAICITHHAALEYCRWLSTKTGKTYRLPTEAEWEYACRAGTTTAYSFGDDPADLEEYAWSVDNAEKPEPTGKKKPNPWGLYDMHGNVAEWCMDHYVEDIYTQLAGQGVAVGPVVIPTAKEYSYVVRGGSWEGDAEMLRSAARLASSLEFSIQDPQRPRSIWWHTDATFVGFRVARPAEEQENLKGFRSPVVKLKGTK